MKNQQRKITGGVYLVFDPAPGIEAVLPIVQQAIEGGISVVQIWNHFQATQNKIAFAESICRIAHPQGIPVLMNDDWQLLLHTALDGVHFDTPPENIETIRQQVNRPMLCGITCGNQLDRIYWANEHQLDYVSFCSLFPSASAGACEIVSPETVKQARQLTQLPIFLAGGITLQNLPQLAVTGFNGVALISAISKAPQPQQAAAAFSQQLKNIITHESIAHS